MGEKRNRKNCNANTKVHKLANLRISVEGSVKTRQKTMKRGEGDRNKKHSETAHKTNKTQIRAKGNRQHKETPRGEGRVGEGVGENETKNVKRREEG